MEKECGFLISNVEKNDNDTEILYTIFQLTAQFRFELHTLKMKASNRNGGRAFTYREVFASQIIAIYYYADVKKGRDSYHLQQHAWTWRSLC